MGGSLKLLLKLNPKTNPCATDSAAPLKEQKQKMAHSLKSNQRFTKAKSAEVGLKPVQSKWNGYEAIAPLHSHG